MRLLHRLIRPQLHIISNSSSPLPHFFKAARAFSISSPIMASQYRLKGLANLSLSEGEKQEVEVEGIENGKVLLVNSMGKVQALSPNCTHYGAPLKNGVVSSDGRLTCPWHGACFNVGTGDVEDAPALDPLATFDLAEKDGAVYITGDESSIKANRRTLNASCASVQSQEKVVIVGGGSGATAAAETLRKEGFKGEVTVVSEESTALYDRTKLSKAYITDPSKVTWRSPDFYKNASITITHDSATSIDFPSKTVHTHSGASIPYTKLILATGGTPKSLPLPGLKQGELQNVFLLRTLEHTQAIMTSLGDAPKKVVVIGSSFIGMESANCLASQKHDVTVIGMESQPTEAIFGPRLGSVFRALLEKNGVKFHMSAQVSHASASAANPRAVAAVHLKDGTALPADVVVCGVGVAPATSYLRNSPGAPELLKDGSVSTNENFAVAGLDAVYAVGDIATYPYAGARVRIEHWNVAQNAGRTAAKQIARPGTQTKPFIPVFWSALGAQLRYCGNTAASGGWDDVVVEGETEVSRGVSFVAFFTKGERVVAVASMARDPVVMKCAELMRRGRMLTRGEVREGGADKVLGTKV